jgi:endonuclease
LHYKPKPGEDDLFFQLDSNHFRLYDVNLDPLPIHGTPNSALTRTLEMAEESEMGISTEFAYESDLRDYLAKNLLYVFFPQKLEELMSDSQVRIDTSFALAERSL